MQLLNTLKVNISKSLKFIKELCSKKTLRLIADEFYNPDHSDEKKALSAAFGIFMGILPIWGFQTLAALFVAVALKLNKTLVGVFLLISFPPLIPLIVFLSYRIGGFWVGNSVKIITSHTKTPIQNIAHLQQYLYGSISLAITAAIAIGILMFLSLKLIKMLKQFKLTFVFKYNIIPMSAAEPTE
jgi:uncharacterized protein (DUF2062 family)